jgi:hypothetical protein
MEHNPATFRPRDGRTAVTHGPRPLPGPFARNAPPKPVATKTGSGLVFAFAILISIVLVGRVFDFVLIGFHLPAIICTVSLIVCLCSGGLALLGNRVGLPLLGLIGWMFLATPFSTWKGDSASVAVYFAFFTLMWLPMAMGPRSFKDIHWLILLLAVLNVITLLLTKDDPEGRLKGIGGSFSNSEDIGLIAIMSIPFWMLIASRVRLFPVKILIGLASSLFLVRIAALTGSRATLLAAFGMGLVHFVRSGVSKKVVLIVGALIGIGLIVATVPDQILQRLTSVVDVFGDNKHVAIAGSTEAMDSATERQELLLDSIRISLTHPLFGIGPGQFAIYRWQEGKDLGFQKGYLVTHNAYTELASEDGIPGLIFFIGIVIATQRTIQICRKLNSPGSHKDWQAGRNIATCLQMSFVSIVICGFFLANAQYIFWYLIGGIALGLERVTLHLIAEERLQTVPQLSPGQYRAPTTGFSGISAAKSKVPGNGIKGFSNPRLRPQ